MSVDTSTIPREVQSVSIPEQKVFDGNPFPLVLNPADQFQAKNSDFWSNWVTQNLEAIEKLLVDFGAILFRDFPFETPKEFDDFAGAYGYRSFPYEGLAVRAHVVGNVYTSVEQPKGVKIPLHHEMAHVRDYPHLLFFYADVPATEGGETPIALSNVIFRQMEQLEPEIVRRLEREGLRYTRVAPGETDVNAHCGRSWRSTFGTEKKEEAERKARAAGYDVEWLDDGSMKTTTPELPGIRVDERTGKKMWFNAIFNAVTSWSDSRNDATKAVFFPNGDTIPPRLIKAIDKVGEEVKVTFAWKKRDVLLLDNRTTLHSRASDWMPSRRILASLYTDNNVVLSAPK